MKKSMILHCVKVLFLLSLLCAIVVFGYSYVVINELKLKLDQNKISKSVTVQADSIFEKDTKVRRTDLNSYLLFSEAGNIEKFYKDRVENKELEIKGNLIYSSKDVVLPKIQINSCQRFNCIQIKKDMSEIPSSIWKGLLGTEDFRFLEHRGVDPKAILRAIVVDIIAMKFVQGGSTLTQQLVKNLFLTNERKLSRKIKEMIYAFYIEHIMDKKQILNLYLNEVFWGTFQGVYIKGFYGASLAYFGKAPKFLDEYEATMLISLLKGPNYYRPTKKIDRWIDRTNAVFKRLQSLSQVTADETIHWSKPRWEQYQKDFIERNKKNDFKAYYELSKNRELVLEPLEKIVLLNAIAKNQRRLKERTKDADIGIKILIGDKSCDGFDCAKTYSFYSKFERDRRKAITKEFHQVGSLFKPIVYESFIELGRSYEEEISTKPITLNLKSGKWTPKDYSKAKEETILLKTALQKSKNIPLIRVASEVGFENLEDKLSQRIPRLKTPLEEFPAQLLGAIELSLEEVFQAYSSFIKEKCYLVKNDEVKLENSILYYMSVAGETTISRIARPPLKDAYVFGKTGTTNNGLDNWYFAFDGKQIYVFWFGVDSERNKHNLRISGASTSFMIFQDFMNFRGKQISELLCE